MYYFSGGDRVCELGGACGRRAELHLGTQSSVPRASHAESRSHTGATPHLNNRLVLAVGGSHLNTHLLTATKSPSQGRNFFKKISIWLDLR